MNDSTGTLNAVRAAERVQAISASGTMAVSQKVRDLAAQGIAVINMGGGDPDFSTPPHIIEAAVRSLHDGETHYVHSLGLPALRQSIHDKLAQENHVSVSPDAGIIVTPGAKFAVLLTLLAHLNPGDEVLIADPSWVSYAAMVRLAEAVAVAVPTSRADGFLLHRDRLMAALTPRTRAIIVSTPCNPTGHVLDQGEIAAIGEIAAQHALLVISDEIYERISYPGTVHRSLAATPALADRTLTVNGFSKGYAMTGWRLGWVAGPDSLMKPLQKVQQHSIYCVAPFIQQAGVAALTGPQDALRAMVDEYRQRRDAFVQLLRNIPDVSVDVPEAAFYVLPHFKAVGVPSRRLANELLDVGGVAATAGSAFGSCSEGHIRFTLRVGLPALSMAAAGIQRTLEAISAKSKPA